MENGICKIGDGIRYVLFHDFLKLTEKGRVKERVGTCRDFTFFSRAELTSEKMRLCLVCVVRIEY